MKTEEFAVRAYQFMNSNNLIEDFLMGYVNFDYKTEHPSITGEIEKLEVDRFGTDRNINNI